MSDIEIEKANAPTAERPSIAAMGVEEALTSLRASADVGLTPDDVASRRKEAGYNEVAQRKQHPVLHFLRKFWGISAWMQRRREGGE